MADQVKKIEYPADPNRCQAVTPMGQCLNVKEPGSDFCSPHGDPTRKSNRDGRRNYALNVWQQKLDDKVTNQGIKSLREEIGILRVLLEERLNQCKTNIDLLLHSAAVSDLVLKIEKLVSSCHRLEGSMGQLLDKAVLIQFANEIIGILSTEINDRVVLDNIATKIIDSIAEKNQ